MTTPNEKLARAYIDLVEINKSANKGYQEAASGVSTPQIKTELKHLADQRAQFASELAQQASRFGVKTDTKMTVESSFTNVASTVQRNWMNVKTAVSGHNEAAILNECETVDTTALKAYDMALKEPDLPQPVKQVIEQQRNQIVSAKNTLSQLKNQAKSNR
ncbi:hypothetical protein AUC43_14735 [Hymenobacter sedentarius]|uniref:DUF2383 domain-containing protein n=1 Tax=Hymenobacter sedentarius TaxID=1411621 RepID=A0A0U4BS14_9BACT|nr:PA2169 family four-helix-bundle protein [Hymenobacter sedentarius]ALW86231.1 hypothetical protein AUC43_14735 [Hymenobacter sedentarius]